MLDLESSFFGECTFLGDRDFFDFIHLFDFFLFIRLIFRHALVLYWELSESLLLQEELDAPLSLKLVEL